MDLFNNVPELVEGHNCVIFSAERLAHLMTGSCSAGIMTLRSRGMKVIGWSRLLDLLRTLPWEGGFEKPEARLGLSWIEWQVNGLLSWECLSESLLSKPKEFVCLESRKQKRLVSVGCWAAMSLNRQVTNNGDPSLLS